MAVFASKVQGSPFTSPLEFHLTVTAPFLWGQISGIFCFHFKAVLPFVYSARYLSLRQMAVVHSSPPVS